MRVHCQKKPVSDYSEQILLSLKLSITDEVETVLKVVRMFGYAFHVGVKMAVVMVTLKYQNLKWNSYLVTSISGTAPPNHEIQIFERAKKMTRSLKQSGCT